MSSDPFGGDSSGHLSYGPGTGDDALDGGRYANATAVGAGGMGRVESVTDQHLRRQVARKTVLDPSLVPRLLREARLTARLDHPNIVTVHDVGTGDDGLPYYTMRLVRGRSLAGWVDEVGPGLRWVDAVRTTAAAMAYAHEQGVVHRDLKPDNVMVGPLGEVVVVDWGLALAIGEEDGLGGVSSPGKRLTRVGDVVGTPAYMAPEQAEGRALDGRADVFSLGRILTEVLGETLVQHPELLAIVECATTNDVNERYASAASFAADLDAWRDGQRVRAHRYTLSELFSNRIRAWRPWLIRAGAVGVLGAVVVGYLGARVVLEGRRAEGAERETRALLAETLAEQAEAALREGDITGARRLVDRSMRAHNVARAVGVAMALPQAGSSHVISDPSCETVRIHPSGEPIVCLGEDLTVLNGAGEVLSRHPRPTAAGFGANGLVARDADGIYALGGEHLPRPYPIHGRFVGPLPGLDAAVVDSRQLHLARDGEWTHNRCPNDAPLLDAIALDDGWLATCAEGGVLLGQGLQKRDYRPIGGGRWSAVAALPDGALALGTLDHELVFVSREGERRRVLLPDIGPISLVNASPSGNRVIVSSAVGRHVVVRVQDGAVLDAFDTSATHFSDDDTVRAIGRSWVEVTLAGQPSWVVAPHGVGSVLLHQSTQWFGTGEGSVGQWSATGTRLDTLGTSTIMRLLPAQDTVYATLSLDGAYAWRDGWTAITPLRSRDLEVLPDGLRVYGYSDLQEDWVNGVVTGSTTDVTQHRQSAGVVLKRHPANHLTLNELELGVFEGPMAVTDHVAAAISADTVTLWSPTGEPLHAYTVGSGATAMALTTDRVAVGYIDGTLRVFSWDGDELAIARVHRERVASLSIEGKTLLSGGWDRRVQRWDLSVLER